MSNFVLALICGVAAAAWTYNKFMKTTGSNTRNSIWGGVVFGILAFLTVFIGLSLID